MKVLFFEKKVLQMQTKYYISGKIYRCKDCNKVSGQIFSQIFIQSLLQIF